MRRSGWSLSILLPGWKSNSGGAFVFSNLPNGTYYLLAKVSHHLQRRYDGLVISDADTDAGVLATLLAGDVNGDTMVSILDATSLKSVWGIADPAGDIDRNGLVDAGDLAWVDLRFGGIGEQ